MINRKEFDTGTGTLLTPLSINLSYQHQPKPHLNLVAHTFNKYRKPRRKAEDGSPSQDTPTRVT
jgi:hypothetical protein